jgi:hypothetical protein
MSLMGREQSLNRASATEHIQSEATDLAFPLPCRVGDRSIRAIVCQPTALYLTFENASGARSRSTLRAGATA